MRFSFGIVCDVLEHPSIAEVMQLDVASLRKAIVALQPWEIFNRFVAKPTCAEHFRCWQQENRQARKSVRAKIATAANSIKAWLTAHQADLDQAVVNLEKLVAENFCECTQVAPGRLYGFLPGHFASAARSKLSADAREMPVRLTYCVPISGGAYSTRLMLE